MENRKKYEIDLNRSRIVIAIAQVAGPLPDGKHKTVINERETLGWKSLEDMKSRVDKAHGVVDELSRGQLKPDIIVFPEYSFPVQKALPELQEQSDRHGFIIVGGADSIWQADSTHIFNQSPIIVPNRKHPIWATKRVVSQWEQGLVDEPTDAEEPLLTWQAGGKDYWISVHICLDFSIAQEEFKRGSGLFVVPMCSPDVMSFLGWADSLLRLDGGTATILCNCVGEGSKGQSGVVAVNPDGRPFQAALELSTTKEQVAVFEIELQHLSPPKKTGLRQSYPLIRRFFHDLQDSPEGVQLTEMPITQDAVRKRGVINPAIFFDVLGKKMRMAFLNVPQYAEIERSVKAKDYEVLAILGKEDLMVTHLAADRYDMIFDVTQAITWIGIKGNAVTPEDLEGVDEDNFPHFRVDTFYKVLGVPVSEADQGVFTSVGKPFPNFEDIGKVFKLGQHWGDPDVSDEDRTRYRKNRWILDVSETPPGQINAVMTIRLQHARNENKSHLLTRFEEEIMPELKGNPQITSIYRGVSPGLGIDYVLRLSFDLQNGFSRLYELIQRIHDLSIAERLMIDSTTYIVVNNLARLSLPKAVLVTNLPKEFKRYRDSRISPYLSSDERVRLIYQSEKEQLDFITQFRPVDEAFEEIGYLQLDAEEKRVLQRRLTRGLFNRDLESLKPVHDQLQMTVEKTLTGLLKERLSKEQFSDLKAGEGIQSQKTVLQLSYSEKIKIASRYFEATGTAQSAWLSAIKPLGLTIKVRNAFSHLDTERLSIEDCITTLVDYCTFVLMWNKASARDQPAEESGDKPFIDIPIS